LYGIEEWWRTIFTEPSGAFLYWNVYSALASLASLSVK